MSGDGDDLELQELMAVITRHGFIDGEGFITLCDKDGTRKRPMICWQNSDCKCHSDCAFFIETPGLFLCKDHPTALRWVVIEGEPEKGKEKKRIRLEFEGSSKKTSKSKKKKEKAEGIT